MNDLVWEEPPPPSKSRPGAFTEKIDELKRHPCRWALLYEDAPGSTVSRLRKAGCEVRGDWALKGRDRAANRVKIWARWPVTS